jgi:hypothetical protein
LATFHLGPFATAAIPVLGVQVTMLVASLCALTLAALFAERWRNELALLESNETLELALGGAQLGVRSVDLTTGAFDTVPRKPALRFRLAVPGAAPSRRDRLDQAVRCRMAMARPNRKSAAPSRAKLGRRRARSRGSNPALHDR